MPSGSDYVTVEDAVTDLVNYICQEQQMAVELGRYLQALPDFITKGCPDALSFLNWALNKYDGADPDPDPNPNSSSGHDPGGDLP